MAARLLQGVALFARRHYSIVFGVLAVLVVISLIAASRLRFDTDVMGLLPQDEPVVDTFRETLEEFGSLDYLLIAIRIPDGATLDPYETFTDRLGEELTGLESLREVDYKIGDLDQLMETFLPKAFLFLSESEKEEVERRLSDQSLQSRALEMRRLISTPQALAMKQLIQLDPMGLAEIFIDRLTTSRGGIAIDWASGFLLSRDHRMVLILAKPVSPPQNVDFARGLVDEVEKLVERTSAEWEELAGTGGPPLPEVALGGRYVIALGDEDLIRRDVITNVVTSMAGVLLLFLFAFRRFGVLLYAFVPLTTGLALTFGFSAVAYGVLSSATSGTAALLIGLGIDFIIVSYGRYVEERHRGASLSEALVKMNRSSGRAVVVGAVTSAATFYSFGITRFTGLSQMGFLTGTGILMCMIAVLLLLPAMLAWNEDHHERRASVPRLYLHGFGSARIIRFSLDRPRVVLVIGGVMTVVAAFLSLGLRFDDSVQSMRPAGNPGVLIRDEIAERYETGFDQMMVVVRGDTADEVIERAAEIGARMESLIGSGVLTGVDSISSVIPPSSSQDRMLDWLAAGEDGPLDIERIETEFAKSLAAAGMRAEPFARGMALLEEALGRRERITPDEFTDSLQASKLLGRYLRQEGDEWTSVVYLYPPPKRWRRRPPPEVAALAAEFGPEVVLTGANVVSEFLRRRVLRDAMLAALLGFVLVGILLWFDYRNVGDTLLSLGPLLVGIMWMLGGMVALGIVMNFMNIFVTTMVIGIGVDYGVHMIHRYREFQGKDRKTLHQGLEQTGKAIVLAALSTIVGFGSLSLSHYPGLRSMGVVAILGALSTSLAAVTVLPAYLRLRRDASR